MSSRSRFPRPLLVVASAATVVVAMGANSAGAQDAPRTAEERGAAFLELIPRFGSGPPPHGFFPDGERVWYVGGTSDSTVIYVVDPSDGAVTEWLDVARTRGALQAAGANDLPGKGLPFRSFQWIDGNPDHVRFEIRGEPFVLDVSAYSARPASDAEREAWSRAEPRAGS